MHYFRTLQKGGEILQIFCKFIFEGWEHSRQLVAELSEGWYASRNSGIMDNEDLPPSLA